MRLAGLLLLIFAISIGVATFLENDFGTSSAKAAVYNARWFEVIIGLLIVNFTVVIFTHRLYRKEKIVQLIFHCSFILILVGAAVTRYIGYEGAMHIREGKTANTFISTTTYVSLSASNGNDRYEKDKEVLFSSLMGADYSNSFKMGNEEVEVDLIEYIPNATYTLEDSENGQSIITIVTTGDGGRLDKFLRKGRSEQIGNVSFSFGDSTRMNHVHIIETDSGFIFRSPTPIRYMRMADQGMGSIEMNTWHSFEQRHLYVAGGTSFVFKDYHPSATIKIEPSGEKDDKSADVLRFKVSKGNLNKEISVVGGKGILQDETTLQLGDTRVSVGYGALLLQLPFSIQLRDFQLDRYPGSDSPSSYASEVTLIDESENISRQQRVYMNHILEHKGFRFYQSSYDQDEKGTILSVNHDYWGTFITYWGYFFLAVGLIAIFFSPNTRFATLSRLIGQIHARRAKLATAMILFPMAIFAQELNPVSPEHAEKFGTIIHQEQGGRMVPLNTISSQILRKVVKKNTYKGLTPDQVFIGMISNSEHWRDEKMIRVKSEDIMQLLGVEEGQYASFIDFFTPQGDYKIREQVEAAFNKKPAERDIFDKEIMHVDERVNICYMTYFGNFLKVFPIPGHPEDKWTTPYEEFDNLSPTDSIFITGAFQNYFQALKKGKSTGDYSAANEIIDRIKAYQLEYGSNVIPSETKVSLEIFYNKANIFKRLFPYYTLVGFIFLIVLFTRILQPKWKLNAVIKVFQGLIVAGFIVHLGALVLRWYLSGHEPWSNGYESMIYIAWATLLAGLLFYKKSAITMAVTALLSGIILFVAHLSWMDPEITNLVPVLNSYWLTIHVATITSSYGFLALGALLGFISLVSMIIRRKSNYQKLTLTIKELTYVTEMTLTVGLVLLTIGNFLGGIWANESWGRYWGWDPKETWAMATIIFYAFFLHMRFIPGLRGFFAFNFAALIGFSSVIMTYFGVNYYLSGLHSYAKGDPVPIPTFVYYSIAIIGIISLWAYLADKFIKPPKGVKPQGKRGKTPNGSGKKPDAKLETAVSN